MLTYPTIEEKEFTRLGLVKNIPGKVEIISGEEVSSLLVDLKFQSAWDDLYENCPWAGVFQSRVFNSTWYKIFKDEYFPIIIKAEQEDGKLTGLLTLALHSPIIDKSGRVFSKVKRIGGAGHFEAEYQTWLLRNPEESKFVEEAFQLLIDRFPGHHIAFRYLPHDVPIDWIKNSKKWKNQSIIQPFKRPLVQLEDPEVAKQSRHSHFRNKLNRLKRLGEVEFERITNKDSFSLILNDLTTLYDFRQGAMFNKTQFKDEPLKKELLLAQFDDNILHATVLKVNKKVFAAIVAIINKNWVHLGGINCHSPYNSRFYSPGFMQFAMLGNLLAQEGFEYFDLTPGYDSYKEQFATRHDYVHELIIGGNFIFRFKRVVRKKIHDLLVRSGKRPMTVELNLKRSIYLAKHNGVINSILSILKKKKVAQPTVYTINPNELEAGNTILLVEIDSLKDLLQFDQEKTSVTRWEFLSKAMANFEDEKHCPTWCDKNRLLGCFWISNSGSETVLKEFYIHSSKQKEATSFILSAIHRVKSLNNSPNQILLELPVSLPISINPA